MAKQKVSVPSKPVKKVVRTRKPKMVDPTLTALLAIHELIKALDKRLRAVSEPIQTLDR